ncbi:hypothetical protein SFSGTM_20450 [Sulfuriferula nivalis]|uniref:AsmA domain-containing protein n=2 Tax=Sulfuriferula nivalis TaxID=2675298 RepID=A0A809SEE0_9PROT|nr:hypothetical protein SFSGTM_20450 [Sulfuriferula nivalis]
MAALAVTTLILVIFFDWNWLRHPIERFVAEKTGRALIINGNLNIKLGWPLARIQATDISFANPDWAKQPLMFTVKQIDGKVSLPELFKRHVSVLTLNLTQPQVFLEQSSDGRKNWLLDRNQQDENAKIKIDSITLDNGQISYTDTGHDTQIQAALSTHQSLPQTDMAADIIFTATGKLKGLALTASGSGGTVLNLNDEITPYPLNIDISLGHTQLHAAGTVTSLSRFSAVDLNIALNGTSLDQLYPLIGIALPRTLIYSTKGHLLHSTKQWRYEKFTARIGKSDLSGNLQIDSTGKRPFLKGDVTFQKLDLADLGSPIGMSNKNKGKASDSTQQTTHALPVSTANKRDVLPELPFRTERWDSVDADVRIQAKHIQRARALPIDNLVAHVKMNNAILTLDPISFGVAGGTLAGTVTLNGKHDPIQAKVNIHARKIQLNQLFPTIKLTRTSIGQIHGEFDLSGTGNAVDQMLASANGRATLVVDGGKISKLMLETAGLHLWEMLQLKVTGDEVITLNCAVADFDVKRGNLQTKIMVLDTDITTIMGRGNIDMAQETLDLELQPHTKILSPLALHSPIYIRGKFAKPVVSLDKTKLILRGAGAIALGVVNPLLVIIPLIDSGPGKDSACGKLIRRAQH